MIYVAADLATSQDGGNDKDFQEKSFYEKACVIYV